MELTRRYLRNSDFVFRRIADEMILVPIRHKVGDLECLYSLNTTAARIWELLDGRRDLATVQVLLAREFEVKEEELAADLLSFVDQLASIRAVAEVSSEAANDREASTPSSESSPRSSSG